MELKLNRPLLFFDIESTGLNIATDGIIELSFVKVMPEGGAPLIKTWKIKPWDYRNHRVIPISPSASEVNGVKDEDLVNCPKFIEVLPEVAEWLAGSDLAGFNSTKFDLPLLAEEIERVRDYCNTRMKDPKASLKAKEMLDCIERIDLHDCKMVDVQNIYHHMEPRNLKAAYRFYCGGKDFENAHTAEADTVATYEVLKAQLDRYNEPTEFQQETLKNDVDALAKIGARARTVDFAGRLYLNDNGEPTISFGKHKGRTAREVWETEPSYFAWIENGEFTLDTKHQFALLKEQFGAERKAGAAAKRKPLNDSEVADAAKLLSEKWSGKLF
ncbi:MAG: 3'-5' exonuclease [Bacteroidales bacterium]|nr:3'-5' exonuclease [Bacteroidales bacterium]